MAREQKDGEQKDGERAGGIITLAAQDTPPVMLTAGQTEREAQLLVCGHYPDKNLRVSEADLDDIVAEFSADTVPIKLEHTSTVLDPLGLVKTVWREGRALMGRIAFDAVAAPLLAARPVKRLSVGLDRDAQTRRLSLAEVSLVLKPRLATAALLSEDADRDAQIATLRAELTAQDVEAKITLLKRAGKMTPAMEPLARALLSAADGATITLSDGSPSAVADTSFRLLSALPRLVTFSETAPGKRDGSREEDLYGDAGDGLPELTPAQTTYCRDVLKVDPKKVRETMKTTTRIGTSDQPKARV